MTEEFSLPKCIVAAVDGSEESLKAARYAIDMAKLSNGRVTALHVILLPQYIPEEMQDRLRTELTARGKVTLDALGKAALDKNVQFVQLILDTTTSEVSTICDYSKHENADLLVLGTRGTSGTSKLMLGSVAEGVVNRASCPVLIFR